MGSYSDSEPEVFYPYYCLPPPPPQGKMVWHPGLARMRFSSGSLQLDEQDEGEEEEASAAAKEKTKKEVKGESERKQKTGDEKKSPVKITKVTL